MFKVQILGSSSATPAFSRNPSAQVVTYLDRHYLVDCGEATQMQLQKFRVKFSRLDAVFISHLHGDHILGLPGLLSSVSIYERSRPFPIYAPAGMKEIIDLVFKYSDIDLKYELEFHALEDYNPGEVIYKTDKLQVESIELQHRSFCRGYIFREYDKKPKFDFYKAKSLGIPNNYFKLLKAGNEITLEDGTKVKPEEVLKEAGPALSYSYCSDTQFDESLPERIKNVTTLYHEATFMHELQERAIQTQHSTAKQAGTIARLAEVDKLLIGHFSARYRDLQPLLEEAKSEFPNTELALEGNVFDIRKDV